VITIKQSAHRIGERGNVHDVYVLLKNDVAVALIKDFVEYSLDEVPVEIEPVMNGEIPLTIIYPKEA
jgi:hypothetical protein